MKIGDLTRQRTPLDQMTQGIPGPVSGFGGGTWGADGTQATPVQQPEIPGLPPELLALRPQKREGWKNIVGTILDVVAAGSGYKPGYWSGLASEKQEYDDFNKQVALQQMKAREALQQRQADREARSQEWMNQDPYRRTLQNAGIDPDSPQGKELMQKRARNQAEPMQFIPDGFGGGQMIRQNSDSGLPGGYDPNEWEVIPGPQGGPTPPASGGFR